MNIVRKHQLKIARKTIRMTDSAVKILGGMTKEEARQIINREKVVRQGKKIGK